jgi:hypothetical protein
VAPVWWPGIKNSPNVTHACRKRRLKWGPPGWGLGVGLTSLHQKIIVTKPSDEPRIGGRNVKEAKAYPRL